MFEEDRSRDPLSRYKNWLIQMGLMSSEEIALMRKEIFSKVEQAAIVADSLPHPDPATLDDHLFVDAIHVQEINSSQQGESVVMVDALNRALDEEMAHDAGVVVFGQDVAHGKGGVFGVTRQLTARYGNDRCFNTPLAESTIIGLAIGMSFVEAASLSPRSSFAITCGPASTS